MIDRRELSGQPRQCVQISYHNVAGGWYNRYMKIDAHVLQALIRERLIQRRLGGAISTSGSNGLTQRELGKAVGVSRTTIANIEAGRQNVSLELLYRFVVALDVQLSDLLPSLDELYAHVTADEGLAQDDGLPASWSGAIDRVI